MPAPRGSRRTRSTWYRASFLILPIVYLTGFLTGVLFCGSLHLREAETDSTRRPASEISPNRTKTPSRDASTVEDSAPKKLMNPNQLKFPTPIIAMGLMKAGTTSIYGYFKCGLDPRTSKLSHYDCNPGKNSPDKIGMACGKRIRRNIIKLRRPAFDTIDHFTLYAEIDGQENNGGMTLPQWDYLEQIYDQFPNASWILNLRKPQQWLSSVDRWVDLRQRFIDNPYLPDLPKGVGQDDGDMIRFYKRQAQRIREFCESHPSLSCVEVSIDNANAGMIMEEAFGISRTGQS